MTTSKALLRRENALFFRRWLKSPTQLGTLAPISQTLARDAANLLNLSQTTQDKKIIVEIGAGTGRLSREILAQGINPKHFYAVELDGELSEFLTETLPGTHIIHGDATLLSDLLPPEIVGNVDVLYSVIPLMYLSQEMRDAIYQAAQAVLKPGGLFYHVCYSPISPFKNRSDIASQRVISKWINLPPGFVWIFENA